TAPPRAAGSKAQARFQLGRKTAPLTASRPLDWIRGRRSGPRRAALASFTCSFIFTTVRTCRLCNGRIAAIPIPSGGMWAGQLECRGLAPKRVAVEYSQSYHSRPHSTGSGGGLGDHGRRNAHRICAVRGGGAERRSG